MAQDQWVEMVHPNLPNTPPARVTSKAFYESWDKKGWVLLNPEAGYTHSPTQEDYSRNPLLEEEPASSPTEEPTSDSGPPAVETRKSTRKSNKED